MSNNLKDFNGEVCASIIEENEDDVYKTVKKALLDNPDYLELRLDSIKDITQNKTSLIIDNIKKITDKPIILTNRTKEEGGLFKGTEFERITLLKENASKVEIVDIEYNTIDEYKNQIIENANKTIISYHNFLETPRKDCLQDIITNSKKIGDIAKIAVMPRNKSDTLLLLELVVSNSNTIGISMDKIGSYTRIVGPILGSPITYASIDKKSAPGQFDIKTTKEMLKQLRT